MSEMWETPSMSLWRFKETNGLNDDFRERFVKWANDKPEKYKEWYLTHRQEAPAAVVIFSCMMEASEKMGLPNIDVDFFN